MRVARCHPQLGWLRLEARDYSRSLDRLTIERDKLGDPNHSGPAPGYITWMWSEELPALMRKQSYRQQVVDHCSVLARQSEDLGDDIQRLVGSMLEEQAAADQLRHQLTALLDE